MTVHVNTSVVSPCVEKLEFLNYQYKKNYIFLVAVLSAKTAERSSVYNT